MYAATSLRPRTQTTRFLLAFSPISLTDIIFQWLKFVWSSSLWLLLLGWSYKLVTSKQTMFVVLLPWDLRKNWLGIQYRVRRKYGSWELCERNDNSRWKKKHDENSKQSWISRKPALCNEPKLIDLFSIYPWGWLWMMQSHEGAEPLAEHYPRMIHLKVSHAT